MPGILEIPEVRQRVSRLSVQEYHRLDEYNQRRKRTELIRGIVIEKAPKSPLHTYLAKRLEHHLMPFLPKGLAIRLHDPLTLADSEPEPDIAVVRGCTDEFFKTHPTTAELVVEVAAADAVLEREIASVYAEANVAEYWILLPEERKMEIFRLPSNGRYLEATLLGLEDLLECSCLPCLRIRLKELFQA